MHFQKAIQKVFDDLSQVIDQLSCLQYSQSKEIILNASIGQHVRHILELFTELEKGYELGIVNYDKRKRDRRIETDRQFAKQVLSCTWPRLSKPDKTLLLAHDADDNTHPSSLVTTNYFRELIYNLEHAIHHMALIRIGVKDIQTLQVTEDFGVAPSTIKYRETCAQ